MQKKLLAVAVAGALGSPMRRRESGPMVSQVQKEQRNHMFLDALLKLSAAQQVTADAASTNTIDFGNTTPKRNVASGEPMAVMFAITAIGTNTGSTKLQAIMSAAANLGTPTIVGEIDLATADIAAGKVYVVALSKGVAPLRYFGAYHDITGTVDYTVDCYFGTMSQMSALADTYAKGYTIS